MYEFLALEIFKKSSIAIMDLKDVQKTKTNHYDKLIQLTAFFRRKTSKKSLFEKLSP